jgi:hypothetical protein
MARKILENLFFSLKKVHQAMKNLPQRKKRKEKKDEVVGTSHNISNLQFKIKHYDLKSMLQYQVISQTKYYNVI